MFIAEPFTENNDFVLSLFRNVLWCNILTYPHCITENSSETVHAVAVKSANLTSKVIAVCWYFQ
jgi:hypothetical protein